MPVAMPTRDDDEKRDEGEGKRSSARGPKDKFCGLIPFCPEQQFHRARRRVYGKPRLGVKEPGRKGHWQAFHVRRDLFRTIVEREYR